MGLMFTTVIGFMVCLGLTAMFTMHFLSSAMISADSSTIDPKPDTKFLRVAYRQLFSFYIFSSMINKNLQDGRIQ